LRPWVDAHRAAMHRNRSPRLRVAYPARTGDRPRKSRFLVGRNSLGWQTQILGGAL